MAVLKTDNFSAGSSKAGIPIPDLRLDVVDPSNVLVASQVDGVGSCIIRDLGRGVYLATYEHPDNHRGAAKLMQVPGGPTFLGAIAIEPAGTEITSGVAAAVWRTPDRTLTEWPGSPNYRESPILTRRRGDTWRILFENLGDLTTREAVWFTIKGDPADLDPLAMVQVTEAGGLLILNGAAATPSQGIILVDPIQRWAEVTLDEAATAQLAVGNWSYDFQVRQDGNTTTHRASYFGILADVTRATQ